MAVLALSITGAIFGEFLEIRATSYYMAVGNIIIRYWLFSFHWPRKVHTELFSVGRNDRVAHSPIRYGKLSDQRACTVYAMFEWRQQLGGRRGIEYRRCLLAVVEVKMTGRLWQHDLRQSMLHIQGRTKK